MTEVFSTAEQVDCRHGGLGRHRGSIQGGGGDLSCRVIGRRAKRPEPRSDPVEA